jgi:hypothetical protein
VPPAADKQLTLSPIEEEFVAHGVAEIPDGLCNLTTRELKFVLGVLEHGQMARAATDAGYSKESAGSIASETLRKPKVFAFYRRCVEQVANKGEQLTARVYERSVILHAQALKAAQDLTDAESQLWVLASETHETGKNAKDKRTYELMRERAQRDQKHYLTLANQTDALLGTLLGKIAGVHVTGEVNHKHTGSITANIAVPESALPVFASMRREVLEATRTGGPN